MEKISGIIKSSPRVQAVDLRESNPVRPGTPAFGRPQGVSSLNKPVNPMETSTRAMSVADDLAAWRAKDLKNASIAADMTKQFFVKPTPSEVEVESAQAPPMRASTLGLVDRPSNPSGFKAEGPGGLKSGTALRSQSFGNFDSIDDEPAMLAQPEGLFPKGSFIDRTA